MKKIRIVIADDHAVVRAGLTSVLGFEPDFAIVGEAEDGESAVVTALARKPDVVIMDLLMPGKDGATATVEIKRQQPSVNVLILTSCGSVDELRRALEVGVDGLLMKSVSNECLTDAIRRVAAGERVVMPEVEKLTEPDPVELELSERQREILTSVTKGLRNQDIARNFGISLPGVKKHMRTIFAKLGVSSRAEAVAAALRRHLCQT